MNVNVDLGGIDWKRLRPSRRGVLAIVALGVLIAGGFATWHSINNPPRPWLVRWKLNRYLAKKSAPDNNFKVAFPFPSKEEMAKTSPHESGEPKGSRTGKVFDTLCDEYLTLKFAALKLENAPAGTNAAAKAADLQAKEQALEPITADLWDLRRKMIGESGSADSPANLAKARAALISESDNKLNTAEAYEPMYRALGQELWVAKRLLESKNLEHRRAAVSIAMAASRGALNQTMDGWVAARIAEGYLLPNIDIADDANRQSPFNSNNYLTQCADLFRRNNEFANGARVYEEFLSKTSNAARADWARYQIADLYQQAGDYSQSLTYLKQIQNTNDTRLQRRIAWAQRQVGK